MKLNYSTLPTRPDFIQARSSLWLRVTIKSTLKMRSKNCQNNLKSSPERHNFSPRMKKRDLISLSPIIFKKWSYFVSFQCWSGLFYTLIELELFLKIYDFLTWNFVELVWLPGWKWSLWIRHLCVLDLWLFHETDRWTFLRLHPVSPMLLFLCYTTINHFWTLL